MSSPRHAGTHTRSSQHRPPPEDIRRRGAGMHTGGEEEEEEQARTHTHGPVLQAAHRPAPPHSTDRQQRPSPLPPLAAGVNAAIEPALTGGSPVGTPLDLLRSAILLRAHSVCRCCAYCVHADSLQCISRPCAAAGLGAPGSCFLLRWPRARCIAKARAAVTSGIPSCHAPSVVSVTVSSRRTVVHDRWCHLLLFAWQVSRSLVHADVRWHRRAASDRDRRAAGKEIASQIIVSRKRVCHQCLPSTVIDHAQTPKEGRRG